MLVFFPWKSYRVSSTRVIEVRRCRSFDCSQRGPSQWQLGLQPCAVDGLIEVIHSYIVRIIVFLYAYHIDFTKSWEKFISFFISSCLSFHYTTCRTTFITVWCMGWCWSGQKPVELAIHCHQTSRTHFHEFSCS